MDAVARFVWAVFVLPPVGEDSAPRRRTTLTHPSAQDRRTTPGHAARDRRRGDAGVAALVGSRASRATAIPNAE